MKRILIIAAVAVALTACTTTRTVTVVEHSRDTLRITNEVRDSIYLHDSTTVKEKGDTVWIERWHTKYKERVTHDTIYQSRVDTIPTPYPVEVKVPRELTWWQKTKMNAGVALMVLLGVLIIYGLVKLWMKFKP